MRKNQSENNKKKQQQQIVNKFKYKYTRINVQFDNQSFSNINSSKRRKVKCSSFFYKNTFIPKRRDEKRNNNCIVRYCCIHYEKNTEKIRIYFFAVRKADKPPYNIQTYKWQIDFAAS